MPAPRPMGRCLPAATVQVMRCIADHTLARRRGGSLAPRRLLMTLPLLLALAMGECVSGAAERSITVYMYSEYIDPALLVQFHAATGITATIDVYEAQEEMLAKMRAGGDTQYDVLVASDVVVPPLIALHLVRPLDASHIPNRVNVASRFVSPSYDPKNRYSWPYQWGTIGLMYRPDRIHPPLSWAMIFDRQRQPGPFVLMDEMRSQMAVALTYLGKPIDSRAPADVDAAGRLLLLSKSSPACLGFDGGVGGKNKVMAGEAILAVVYNGDAVKAIAESAQIRGTSEVAFAVPSEGSLLSVDNLLVASHSHDPQAAEAFINFILDAKVGAQLSTYTRYATPNQASLALIAPADAGNPAIYPTPPVMKRLGTISDLGSDERLYDQVWTTVKSR